MSCEIFYRILALLRKSLHADCYNFSCTCKSFIIYYQKFEHIYIYTHFFLLLALKNALDISLNLSTTHTIQKTKYLPKMTSSVASTALPSIKLLELNPYFERFEREREGKIKII